MRVAAVQTTAGSDTDANLERVTPLVDEAAERGAALVVLPEYFSVAGDPAHLVRHAELLDGPTVSWASALARRWGIHLLAGSFPERVAAGPGGLLSNTSCLLGPSGSLDAVYRKIHLFDVHVDDLEVRESATFRPGTELSVAPLGGGSEAPALGLALCYDLRFPEMFRIMAEHGATIVSVPAAFTAVTGPPHWETLVRARALDNQVFVVAAAQVGALPEGMPAAHGHSMIVDPWGEILAEQVAAVTGVIVAELDEVRQRQIRSELPVLAHRRPAAYRVADDNSGGDAGTRR